MNKVGGYGAAFFVCMILCYILGTEINYEYLYLLEIALTLTSGVMLYLAISELYKDIRKGRQAQQDYIEGLKEIVQNSHESLEIKVVEIGDICQKQYMNLVDNLVTHQKTTAVLMKDFSLENQQLLRETSEMVVSTERAYNLRQEEFINEIKMLWHEELENNEVNRKNLIEALETVESFVKRECYDLMVKFSKENETLVERFSDGCKEYIVKLYEESYDSLEKCNNLMDSYVIRQKELIKEIQEMQRKQLQHEKTIQELVETTMVFVQDKLTEMQREGDKLVKEFGEESRLNAQELAGNCKMYVDGLQGVCLESLKKCNDMVDGFGDQCLEIIKNMETSSKTLISEYREDLSSNIDKNWKRISAAVNLSNSLVEISAQEIRDMMEKVTEAVKNVNIENSQYVSQIKEYQKEMRQLSSEDIKIMEEILNGNK